MAKYFCKICGKPIKPCFSCYKGTFEWMNHCCCRQHYEEYLKLVEKAREQKS